MKKRVSFVMGTVWVLVLLSMGLFAAACSNPSGSSGGGGGGGGVTGYTVTFDNNGGDTEAIPRTMTVTPPATTVDGMPKPPDKSGYIFTGWNTEADLGGDSFTAATAVTEDLTVYAQWMADQPSSSLTLYKGTSTADPGKQIEEVSDLASAASWLLTPGNLAGNTEYLAVLGSDLELSTGFILGGVPFLYDNITVTLQGDDSARTIKLKAKSYMSVLSGVTIRLGNNICLRGYNQSEDGENNENPLVFINGGAVETLAGSEISGNVNRQSGKDGYGSGVYLRSGSFTMKGGVVKDNTIIVDGGKTGYGAGVFAEAGTFSMEGGARVDSGNEVCLWESAVITVTGSLSETTAALIRPKPYTDGTAVLGGAAMAANYGRFQVRPNGTETWTIDSDGKLAAPRYTVNFDADGGMPAPAAQTVVSGGTVTEPEPMTKAGHAFGGWYRENTFTNLWDFSMGVVTEGITLYAGWTTSIFTTPAQYRKMVPLAGGTIIGNSAYYYDAIWDFHTGLFIENRTVTLSPFSIAKYQTTYELWYEVRQWAASNGYTFANAGREGNDGIDGAAPTTEAKNEPVTWISWRDVVVWCNAYSEMSGKDPVYYTDSTYGTVLKTSTNTSGTNTDADNAVMKPGANGYRLPTDTEWEYAARGGDPSAPSFAYKWPGTNTYSELENYVWCDSNSGGSTHPVGEKAPNTLGLYDMSGNVWEYCWDWYPSWPVTTGTVTDPMGPASGESRRTRGAAWFNTIVPNPFMLFAVACLTGSAEPHDGYYSRGFRVAGAP